MRGIWSICTVICTLLTAACGDNDVVNQPPELLSFDLTTTEDLPVTRDVGAVDPEGGDLTLAIVDAPAHGTVTATGTSVTYTPAANYNGPDLFSLAVSDGIDTTTVLVDVTITAANDAPIGAADSIAANEDTASVVAQAALLQNDSDVDGDTLTVTAVANGVNGTATIEGTSVRFLPTANFVGSASFEYTLSDGTATTTVAVGVAVGGQNDAPVAVDDAGATAEDTVATFTSLTANDTDPEDQALSVTAVAGAVNGSVAFDGTTVTFTPAADFSGTGSFTYTLSDGIATDTGTVTVTVTAVNDAPIAVDDARSTAEDVPLVVANLAANDTDIDSVTLTVSTATNASAGTVAVNAGTVTYTPPSNFSGTATFDYTVFDGALSDTGTVTVTVTAVNDPPVAVDDTDTTAEDTPITLTTLTANDSDGGDGGTLAITAVGGATNGSVVLGGGIPVFTPAPNFNGTATFQYTVSDDGGTTTDIGLVTLTVTAVNDPPTAVDDTAIVQANASIDIPFGTLTGNDSDGGDGGALTITAVNIPPGSAGTVTIVGTAVRFTPDADFEGETSFEYQLSDGGAITDIGLVVVTVTTAPICGDNVLVAPETCDDGNQNPNDGCSDSCQEETGFDCGGVAGPCAPICGDNIEVVGEACDDGNQDNLDGCTTLCVVGVICDVADFPGSDRVVVDPATGHCYAGFDNIVENFAAAGAACANLGGHLPVVTSIGENVTVRAAIAATATPWLGGDDLVTEGTFVWATAEPFAFTNFQPGQPDDDVGLGGADCINMLVTTNVNGSEWNDTNCDFVGFATGRVCEIEILACGDNVLQPLQGEECDDNGTANGDGCSSTCQLENGCGNGIVEAGEECDDDNTSNTDTCGFPTCQVLDGCGDGNIDGAEQCDDNNVTSGDGCSSTCTLETLVQFTFTGAAGNEATLPADAGAVGLLGIPAMSRGAGVAPSAAGGTFSASGWTTAATIDATDFFAFTLTPDAGFTLSLQALELDERRSATGIRNWSVRSSLDNFATDIQAFTVPDDVLTRTDQRIVLPAAFTGLTTPVEFRIFGFGAEAGSGTWRLDNVEVIGSAAP